jgi:hypothetical protein
MVADGQGADGIIQSMTSRSTILAFALLCGLACDSKPAPADPAKVEAKPAPTDTKAAPKTETKSEAKATPKPEVKADPTPATDVPEVKADPTPVAPPAVPVTQASPAAGVDPPKQARVLELARAKGLAKPALAAKLAEAGARRYVAAIRDRNDTPSGFPQYTLHLLRLRLPEPVPGAAAEWVVDGVVELHRWQSAWIEDAEGSSSIPTTLVVDDHERDGEVEVLVRFRYEFNCSTVVSEITDLSIVELEPTLAVVLRTELHHTLTDVEKKGTAHHEDLDGDGHPDLRVSFSTKVEGEPKPKLTENRWRWVAGDDTWAPLTDGAKLPTEDLAGCEWREAHGGEEDIDG